MRLQTERHLQEFDQDIFSYKKLSKTILDQVLLKMELPNSFGIYGNWGSGKSTMIHYILKHIENAPITYSSVTAVYFEPWKYEYSSHKDLLFALLSAIKQKSELEKSVWKTIMTDVLVVASGVARKISVVDAQDTVADFELVEGKVFKEHELWVNKVQKFKEDFQIIVDQTLQKNNSKKLIVFIDDLDRCLPENAVNLLEGIKNFLSVDKVLFIFAIDKRIVGEMIEKKYGLHDGYGDEYLMKIIQYYYDLPKNNVEQLVVKLFQSYEIHFEDKQIKYISNFLKVFGGEPRIVKHYIHQLCMSIILSESSRELLKNDTEQVWLQFLFVASYLLAKYPKIFSAGSNLIRLRFLRECAANRHNPAQPDSYEQSVKKDASINSHDLKKLEDIMGHPINTGKEGNPPALIDVNKLDIALRSIKVV